MSNEDEESDELGVTEEVEVAGKGVEASRELNVDELEADDEEFESDEAGDKEVESDENEDNEEDLELESEEEVVSEDGNADIEQENTKDQSVENKNSRAKHDSGHQLDLIGTTNTEDAPKRGGYIPNEGDSKLGAVLELPVVEQEPDSRLFNDFVCEDGHGHGAYGIILKCRHKLDGETYAIKRLEKKGKRPMEIVALARLKHPNIVHYCQAWTEGYIKTNCTPPKSDSEDSQDKNTKASEYLYIQMQFCPMTIKELKERGVDRDTRWLYLKQIIEGVRYMHGKGILHCDLSPNNILLDEDAQIRICDFGLARFLEPNEEVDVEPLELLGNLVYRAPEMILGGKVTPKVDIYSVGVMLVDICDEWDTAFEKIQKIEKLKKEGELPKAITERVGPDVQQVLRQMIAANAIERPSAEQILEVCWGI